MSGRSNVIQGAVRGGFFSDFGPHFYYRVIDISPDGDDSVIRYIRVAPAGSYCSLPVIQSVMARVKGKRPVEIVKGVNPCAVKPSDLRSAVEKYKRNGSVFETVSFGIVAQCGPSAVTLSLPIPEQVDFEKLKTARPDLTLLWDLPSLATDPVFGEADVFHDRSDSEDLTLQQAGKAVLSELTSGKYDPGLAAASGGDVGGGEPLTFRDILSDYRGPITATDVRASRTPKLLNPSGYSFEVYNPPVYPVLALQARISGKVELELSVRPITGEVTGVKASGGHRLLQESATDAAKKWRFVPNSLSTEKVILTVDYPLPCE